MGLKKIGIEFRVRDSCCGRKNGKIYQYAVYECNCGVKTIMRVVVAKRSKSCGCESVKSCINRSTTHNLYYNKAYKIWASMKQRCYNPNNKNYHHYGGRGITVSDSWMSFEGFYRDMGDKREGLTLERINNAKGYSKDNCIWATMTTQNRNTRKSRILTIDGISKSLSEWCECDGAVNYHTAHSRFRKGWDHKSIIFQPVHQRR